MKSTGYVLKERAYVGGASPPDTAEDESRFGNDGTHSNITWVKLPSGLWVRSFNGSSSKIVVPSSGSLRPTKTITLMAWVWRDGLATSDFIIAKMGSGTTRSYALYVSTSDFTGMEISEDGTTGDREYVTGATTTITTSRWWHIVGVWNGSSIAIRVNGINELITTTGSAVAIHSNAADLTIGYMEASNVWFTGDIARPKILDYALSLEQIAANFQAERHWFGV